MFDTMQTNADLTQTDAEKIPQSPCVVRKSPYGGER
jgi:hypothetical protein